MEGIDFINIFAESPRFMAFLGFSIKISMGTLEI